MDHFRNPTANYEQATRLVTEFPVDAIDLIAEKCHIDDILGKIERGRQKSQMKHFERISPESEYKGPPRRTSSANSQQSASPPSVHRYPHRSSQPGLPAPLPSPSTSSSGKSLHDKYIIVIADGPEENPVQEHKLSVRNVLVNFSVISQEVVGKRLYNGVRIEENPEGNIQLPIAGVTGGVLQSSEHVTLTWRRPTSRKTHEGLFYLVSNEIDADILLGYTEPTESSSDVVVPGHHKSLALTSANTDSPPVHPLSPHPKRPGEVIAMYPLVTDAPLNPQVTPSFHSSSHVYGSDSASTVREVPQPFLGRPPTASTGYGIAQQPSPTLTQFHPSRPSSIGDPHLPRQTSTATSTPLNNAEQQPLTSDEIAVQFAWDMSSTIIRINLNVTGEQIYSTIERRLWISFKKKLNRETHFIRFKPGRQDECIAEHVLFFDEETLSMNWNPTAAWMRENCNTDSPHLFAFVELDEG